MPVDSVWSLAVHDVRLASFLPRYIAVTGLSGPAIAKIHLGGSTMIVTIPGDTVRPSFDTGRGPNHVDPVPRHSADGYFDPTGL